ncbi:MAG: WD repeat-containing protein 33, partial [Paramarteilia canceri]
DAKCNLDPANSSTFKLQPHLLYSPAVGLPLTMTDIPISSIPSRFARQAQNKMKSSVNALTWTHDGRRLVAGSNNGELTLWNGQTFNFDTILQAHDIPISELKTSNFQHWVVSADQKGFIKYWQSNMNNVVTYQAHLNSAITSLSFAPTDKKFSTAGVDGTVRVWDYENNRDERVYREHGGDVTVVDWHNSLGLIISGSRDNQQSIKMWDPRVSKSILTIFIHKSSVLDLSWNPNGMWFITASRDSGIKLMDLRNLEEELYLYKHLKMSNNSNVQYPTKVCWHPHHHNIFSAGFNNGIIQHWYVDQSSTPVYEIDDAHDLAINALVWHPLGHIMVSGSNDNTSKFWTRDRPGEHFVSQTKSFANDDSESKNLEVYGENSGSNSDTFILPVDYMCTKIPGINSGSNDADKFLTAPYRIDLNSLPPIDGDITSIIPNTFWLKDVPNSHKTFS